VTTHDIFVRGKPHPVPRGKPTDVVVPAYNLIITDTVLDEGVVLWSNLNIYGAEIGRNTKLGAFVEIRRGVRIGARVKIEPFVFLPEGVTLEDAVFIGPNVVFTNDLYPRATGPTGEMNDSYDPVPTVIRRGASVGAGACIRCGITISAGAMIGMGAVVVDDVPERAVVYGPKASPRRVIEPKDRQ
jgi:acetyltransferase-like isoleucine patch superfamily enzyme